jgi:quercetin dioxygenase-like cupin family protein
MKQITVTRAQQYKVERHDWGELCWFASKELRNSGTMTVGKCVLNPGFANPPHSHPNCEEVLHVLQGRVVHTTEKGKETTLLAGDTITIPPGTVHNARNVGDLDAVLIISFSSPERQTVREALGQGEGGPR